jgi:hypothetical protein
MAKHIYTVNIVGEAVVLDRRIDADGYTVRINENVAVINFYVGRELTDDTVVAQARVPPTQSYMIRKDS